MNEAFDNGNTTNRFIFSDDFYNQLGNNLELKEEKNDFVNNDIMPNIEIIKEEPTINQTDYNKETIEGVLETNTNQYDNFIENENIIIDIPKIDIKDNDEVIETKDNSLENNTINEQVDNIENENIIIDIPGIDIKDSNEVIQIKDNPLENNVNETIEITSKEENDNTFNPIPQMNKEVEQEIMKINVESHSKPTIVEQGNWYEEPKEKAVYRAVRNQVKQEPIIYDNNIEVQPIETNPQIMEINKLFKQPPIIDIDALVMHDRLIEEQKRKEQQKEMEKNIPAIKSDLLDRLREKEKETGNISILARYGEDFCSRDYITNPAIGRDEEIKELILILLTPEKSGILVGKPGIGKTAIVEGLAYRLQRNLVPDVLKGYCIVSVKTTSLFGTLPNGETRLQTLIDELKDLDKIILFIDEVHMLMGATKESSLDFANMFKESLGRGSIKMIGATTNDEYERYVLRDKAFVRRFQRVDVEEPSREHTIEILMGSLPRLEKNIGAKLMYSEYIKSEIMGFIVDITTEYKRIYGIGSRYPDICLTLLTQAFSQAVFDNRQEVNIFDIRKAIENSKNIYPDVIRKELVNFDKKFEKIINEN